MEYTKTLGIKSKGDKATLTLSNQGFEVGEFFHLASLHVDDD